MTTLPRRALFRAAGLLALGSGVPLAIGTVVREQWPPDGYTFCEACEGAGWEERFGAFAKGGADNPERLRYAVMEGDAKLLYVLAVGPEPSRWVAEIAWGTEQIDAAGEVWRPAERCPCGSGDVMIRVSYRNGVRLIDHWAEPAASRG